MNLNRFTDYFFRRKSSRRNLAFNDVIDYPDEASISISTPSLRVSSAPSVRASRRTRLDRSVTPPPLLVDASDPVHLEVRTTSDNYAPPVTAEFSKPIRIESNQSFPTEMALSCPTVVAIGTPPAYSASIPSTRPIPGSVSGSIPGPDRTKSRGSISKSASKRGSTHDPVPLPSNVPSARDWNPLNEDPCAVGRPCSSLIPVIQLPSTLSPHLPPPPLEEHTNCCCSRKVALLRNETQLLREELTKYRQLAAQMKEREKLLRLRLSEQARRQIERGGGSKFEDLNLGHNRPSQLIRRYGNLYSDGRLNAMDALDELGEEVAESNDLKEKLLFSVVVLAFRNARRHLEEMKSQMRHVLRIFDSPPTPPPSSHPDPAPSSSGRDPAVTLRARPLAPSPSAVIELEEVISVCLRKTIDQQNLTRNYQEVRERVWETLFDFPKLRSCRGLERFIDECVHLAWALTVQNPLYVVDYKAKSFSPDTHTRFHTSDPDSVKIRTVLWPALREGGGTGPCVYKGVVVT